MAYMTEFQWILAALVGILAIARLTRLLTFDEFPPVKWFRDKWDEKTGDSSWNELFHCVFCASFWVSCLVVGFGFYVGFGAWWWVPCGTLAVSYVAATIVASKWG